MKVLQINACYGYLSTGIIVEDIEKLLIENGCESYIGYQSKAKEMSNGYKIGTGLDRKFHGLYSRIFGKQGYVSKNQTRKFLKWVDEIKPDIVHLHNLHSNYLNFNILISYLAENNIKTVYTFHDCWAFTGKCTHYSFVKCNKWKEACGNCPKNKHEVPSLFFDVTSKVIKDRTEHLNKISDLTIVSCSNWMKKQVELSHLTPKKVVTIYNGVNTNIFKPHENSFRKDYSLNDKFVILGFANKWCLENNMAGVKSLVEQLKDDEKIVIVGCNEEQKKYFSAYKKVIALGFIKDRLELSDIYASSNVFVNLTYEDTLPTVNMESLCCETPVITFNSCGSPELVSNENGMVVEQGNFDAIRKSIDIIKNDGIKVDYNKVKEVFDREKCYKKYIDLYRQIVGEDK